MSFSALCPFAASLRPVDLFLHADQQLHDRNGRGAVLRFVGHVVAPFTVHFDGGLIRFAQRLGQAPVCRRVTIFLHRLSLVTGAFHPAGVATFRGRPTGRLSLRGRPPFGPTNRRKAPRPFLSWSCWSAWRKRSTGRRDAA